VKSRTSDTPLCTYNAATRENCVCSKCTWCPTKEVEREENGRLPRERDWNESRLYNTRWLNNKKIIIIFSNIKRRNQIFAQTFFLLFFFHPS
jgi:hypothetical protein